MTNSKDHQSKQSLWVETIDPHYARNKAMLEKYPEIKKLYGHCPKTKYYVTAAIFIQIFTSIYAADKPWYVLLFLSYVVGGALTGCLLLSIHEASHNLMFKDMNHNRLFGFFINLPVLFPATVSFKRYHTDHHRYLGEESVDVDLPTEFEAKLFKGAIGKFFFVMNQSFTYSLRPLLINPKKPGIWELSNLITQLIFVSLMYLFFGPYPLLYLLLSTYLGMGLHPTAGHFIAEHYTLTPKTETFSYYGFWNFFLVNGGYHNEHHDFPYIPCTRLPLLRKIAPEFYADVAIVDSYEKLLYNFVFDPRYTLHSRVRRQILTDAQKKEIRTYRTH